MRIGTILLLLLGCSGAKKSEPLPTDPRDLVLDRLEAEAEKVEQFRAWYELRDESTGESRLLELAQRGPHTAKLATGGCELLLFRDGAFHYRAESYGYAVPWLEDLRRAVERFEPSFRAADTVLAASTPRAARLAFDLPGWDRIVSMRSLRPHLVYAAGPSRFGWLRPLRNPAFVFDGRNTFRREGDGLLRPAVEAVVDDRGFLVRARILPPPPPGRTSNPGFTLLLKSLTFDPVPDEVFAPPDRKDAIDRSDSARENLRAAVAELIERMLVEPIVGRFGRDWSAAPRDRIGAVFLEYYRADLPRTCDAPALIHRVGESVKQDGEFARRQIEQSSNRDVARRAQVERIRIRRGVHLGQLEGIEERLRSAYQQTLLDLLRSLPGLRKEAAQGMLAASSEALTLALGNSLREPIAALFDAVLAELEK